MLNTNIGVNYRPIKSIDEFMRLVNSDDSALNTYTYEFRSLHIDLKTKSMPWCDFINFIEEIRSSDSFQIRTSVFKIPEFTYGVPSIKITKAAKHSNATAALEFLISKGGVFVMVPTVYKETEVENG